MRSFRVVSSCSLQPRALPGAVADLFLVRSMRRLLPILSLLLATCASEPPLSPRLEAYLQTQKTGICEVHHVPMVGKVVEKYYGLEVHSDEFAAAGWQFPHANASVNGGCDVPAQREKAHLYVCP